MIVIELEAPVTREELLEILREVLWRFRDHLEDDEPEIEVQVPENIFEWAQKYGAADLSTAPLSQGEENR